MKSQLEVAKHQLFDESGLNAADIKLFPGSNRDATPEEMAEQIVRVIAQIEAGDFEEVDFDDED